MKIYFSGIGGVGIGPLAQIAHYAGHEVTGSDRSASLITDELLGANIEIEIGNQNGSFLEKSNSSIPIDLYVYTSALPQDHPELLKAQALGIKIVKRGELLNKIIKDNGLKLIALAGTHGKTSTTAIAVWLFKELGIPASYSIGSTINFGPSGFFDKNSEYFIYECDEFDRNFLYFEPFLSIITSLDYDHPDTYPTEKDYQKAFSDFIKKSTNVVAWSDQPKSVYAKQKNISILNTSKDINYDITLPGVHNRKNASGLLYGLTKIGLIDSQNYSKAIEAINSFPGANRRFERILPNLYTDYGHHPIEISSTLDKAEEIMGGSGHNIVLVYQPHQNIRQHNIKNEYKNQFVKANKIYWLPTYLSREDPDLPILPPQELTTNIINKDSIIYADLNDQLWSQLQKDLSEGSMIICMGAGSIDEWLRKKANLNN